MVSERLKVHVGLTAALMVFVVSFALVVAGTIDRGDLKAALPGSVAPDFALRDAENNPLELSELRGNVVIVYFHGQGESACPTSAPTDSLAVNTPAPEAVASANAAPDLSQLSAMCHQIHSSHLKVLDLENLPSVASADSVASSQTSADVQFDDNSVRTLIDPTGDVARKYKIDQEDSKPTFFVIDPSGVIRYRGNSLQAGPSAVDQLLAPATQPSSCPQVVQTLLSSEAVNIAMPISNHF